MYATLTNFKLYYEEKGEEIKLSDARVIEELKNAAGEINVYLGRRYVLPITQNVPYLRWATCAIAFKMLVVWGASEHDRDDYEDIIRTLEELSKPDSDLALVDENGVVVPTKPITGGIGTQGARYSMVTGNRKGYEIDF